MSLFAINSTTDKSFKNIGSRHFYLGWFLLWLLLIGALVAGFNAVVDPQGRILFIDKPGFNQVKIALRINSRKGKTTALRQCNYDTIVLGTSRAETAIPTEHPALADAEPYNAALRGGTLYEMRRLTEYATRHQNLNTVLLSLDYEAFHTRRLFADDFTESPLAETVSLASMSRYLFSLQTIGQSVVTLRRNIRGQTLMCENRGERERTYELEAARLTFDFLLRRYAIVQYKEYVPGDQHFRHLAALLRELADAGITVYAYLSPVHVTHLELMAEVNLIDDYENWKRELVRIFAEANRDIPEQRQMALWDFSGYNEITTEKVPNSQQQKFMRWYEDSSHTNHAVGNMMLDRMFGKRSGDVVTEKSFGVVLTSDNIDAQIEADRSGSERYRLDNPGEISRLQQMLDKLN